jgi:hypothetical protein
LVPFLKIRQELRLEDSKRVDEVLNTEDVILLFDFLILRDFSDLVFACLDFRDDRGSLNILMVIHQLVGDEVCMAFQYIDCPICGKRVTGRKY